MTTGRAGIRMGVMLMSLWVLLIGTGCAAKRVASDSGDQSETMKGKGKDTSAVENVKEEPMASVDSSFSMGGAPAAELRETAGSSSTGGSLARDPRGTVESPSTPGSGSIPDGAVAPGTRGEVSGAPEMTGMGNIYFDFDRYDIRPDAQPVLEGTARWLRNEQGKSLVIEGHCDERGTLAYNLVLGEKRALSAKRYLENLGIPGSRIQTTSYGEIRPFCKDHNEGCWRRNRRDHFVVQ